MIRIGSAFFLFMVCSIAIAQVGDLIWEDNFNEGSLDLSKWSYETGTGVNGDWGTGQLDRATDRIENVSFETGIAGAEDGCLVITTRDEFYIDRNYTSGRINTAGKSSWGPGHRIVARVYPHDVQYMGQGFAFWMMPDEVPQGWDYIMWPQGGEMDIMEYVGSIPFHNLGSVHYAWFWENNQWQSWNHGHLGAYYSYETMEVPIPSEPGYGNYPPPPNDPHAGSSGFHTYGIDWYSNRIEFFVDNQVYHIHYLNDGDAFEIDGQDEFAISTLENRRVGISEYSNHFEEWYPFEHKMYAILSAGVGGSQYSYGGPIVPDAEFPCSVYIDWVRVYELDENAGVSAQNSVNVQIYPNPANKRLTIQLANPGKYAVRVVDLSGHVVMTSLVSQTAELDISGLSPGMYTVLADNGNSTITKKLVVR